MGKWLDRLQLKNKNAPNTEPPKLTKAGISFSNDPEQALTKPPKDTSVSFGSLVLEECEKKYQLQALQKELDLIQAQWQACLWFKTLPHYKSLPESSYQAERQAFIRMKKRVLLLQSQISQLED